eukprot:3076997-Lingulodinium_polyedra.AAC.1
MVAIKNAKLAGDFEEEVETPEVTGPGPRQDVRKVGDASGQESLCDEPMTDAGSIDPVDVALEDLGNESSATAATDDPVK